MYAVLEPDDLLEVVTLFLPATCHGPVIPGLTSNRA